MNTFHWHLTEDQGWRIEIKKYPLLTSIGSKRKETIVEKNFDPFVGDNTAYGGFYTQDDIKEIVAYAAERFVTVVPEIEMPGHSLAVLAAYPELACTDGPFEVGTKWGVYDDVYCAGNDSVFAFLEDVLDEVVALFPSKFIHIGGDESPKTRWEVCDKCQARMKAESLKDEHELQSYFIRRIENYLLTKDRYIIGWDEILEGGLAPQATVMSWRGEAGGIEAAKQGHKVIMTPGQPCYFDHYQSEDKDSEPLAIGGFNSVEAVYNYKPIPEELPVENQKYILGAQANVWTEYMPNAEHVEYMVFPRLCALSEVVWTAEKEKDFANFSTRLERHKLRLQSWGVNYRK
jgi:hexosaminidase